jgi:uncharacterized protein (DUF983 family)
MSSADRPRLSILIARALRKQCPRCGTSKIFTTFWKLEPRCHNCDYAFEREEGYWVGAIIINTAITEAIFLALFLGILFASLPDVRWQPLLTVALLVNGVFPVLFFPHSKTLWMALDLYIHPDRDSP